MRIRGFLANLLGSRAIYGEQLGIKADEIDNAIANWMLATELTSFPRSILKCVRIRLLRDEFLRGILPLPARERRWKGREFDTPSCVVKLLVEML